MTSRVWIIGWLLGAIMLAGCGGSSGSKLPNTFSLKPDVTGMLINGKLQLLALQTGGNFNQTILWEVVGGAANGTVSAEGLYTAPAAAGTYQVRAYFKDNPSQSATSTITVADKIAVSVSTSNAKDRYGFGEQIRFTATVQGTAPDAYTLKVSPNTTSIDATGLYTTPSTPGLYEITATSTVDPTIKAKFIAVVSDTNVVKLTYLTKGDVYVRMASAEAPNTTKNFTDLASTGYYDGTVMHRYGPDEGQPKFIQGGDPQTKTLPLDDPAIGTGGPGYQINFETNPLKHELGSIAMARSQAKDSAGSQFYICQEAIAAFDDNYVVFGKVIGGLDVATSLRRGDKILTAVVLK